MAITRQSNDGSTDQDNNVKSDNVVMQPQKETKSTGTFLSNLISTYGSNMMDQRSEDYIQNIRRILEDPANKLPVNMKKLQSPNGAVAFITAQSGIILIFQSVCEFSVYDLKMNRRSYEASMSFKQQFPSHKLLNVIIVTEDDYIKYVQMAMTIINNLQMNEDVSLNSFTIDTLKKHQMIINIDKNNAIDVINKVSPHGILNRADFGFTLSAAQKDNNQPFDSSQIRDQTTLFAITGYTEFVESQGTMSPMNTIRYTPIVHISEIVGMIPTPKLLSLALPVAAEVLISNSLWKQPYYGLKKGEPHPGNLILEPKTHTPWVAKTQLELETFFANYINPPILVIDIIEGKSRIPGVEKFLYEATHKDVLKEFSDFLSIPGFTTGMLGRILFGEIVGNVKLQNAVVDSRYIDYLYLLSKSGYDSSYEELKQRYQDINRRMDFISKIAEFKKNYVSTVFQINSDIVKEIGTSIASKLSFYNPSQASIPIVNISYDMGNFNTFNLMNTGFSTAQTPFPIYI